MNEATALYRVGIFTLPSTMQAVKIGSTDIQSPYPSPLHYYDNARPRL